MVRPIRARVHCSTLGSFIVVIIFSDDYHDDYDDYDDYCSHSIFEVVNHRHHDRSLADGCVEDGDIIVMEMLSFHLLIIYLLIC